MRCPKCHYLSFDPEPRCKNCGYDLEVDDTDLDQTSFESADLAEVEVRQLRDEREDDVVEDLPLRPVAPAGRPVTLELVRPAVDVQREVPSAPTPALAFLGISEGPAAQAPARRPAARAPHTTTELPLFVKAMTESTAEPQAMATAVMEPEPPKVQAPRAAPEAIAPPIEIPPASRPLSVRRPVPEAPKTAARIDRRPGPLDHDLLEDLRRVEREESIRLSAHAAERNLTAGGESVDDTRVAVSQRLGAAGLDGLLIGGIGAFVLWATLKVADATPASLGTASLLPIAAFLAGVGIAYLLMFTAADGQTVGKMLMGIRVVPIGSTGTRVTLGQAAGRAVLAPLSVAALGLGWLPAFFGQGLALHDRLAHTRVVRA